MHRLSEKLKSLEIPQKIILGFGVPILLCLFIVGTTTPITDFLNIGYYNRIDPYDINESWWIWCITIMFLMSFEWVLFSPSKEKKKNLSQN